MFFLSRMAIWVPLFFVLVLVGPQFESRGTSVSWASESLSETPIDNFHEILPLNFCVHGGKHRRSFGTLFRGARPERIGLEYLQTLRVSTIVNLEELSTSQVESDEILELGLSLKERLHPMSGGMGVNELPTGEYDHDSIIAAVAELGNSGNYPEYIHCKYGKDRTGLTVALYRVFFECWTPEAAEKEWIEIEGWFHEILNEPKHDYFWLVTREDAALKAYFAKRLGTVRRD